MFASELASLWRGFKCSSTMFRYIYYFCNTLKVYPHCYPGTCSTMKYKPVRDPKNMPECTKNVLKICSSLNSTPLRLRGDLGHWIIQLLLMSYFADLEYYYGTNEPLSLCGAITTNTFIIQGSLYFFFGAVQVYLWCQYLCTYFQVKQLLII